MAELRGGTTIAGYEALHKGNVNLAGNVDHGALGGLTDDDHTQYLRTDGTRLLTGSLVPNTTKTIDIGTAANRFKAIYVDELYLSQNSLYLGDTKILGTNASTVEIKTDTDQNILMKTSGTGQTTISSSTLINLNTCTSNADIKLQTTGTGSRVVLDSANEIKLQANTINLVGATTANSLTVAGNLTVNGSIVDLNATSVIIDDNIVEINAAQTGNGVSAGQAGLKINRGDLAAYMMVFNEPDDTFQIGPVGSTETVATRNWVQSSYTPVSTLATLTDTTITSPATGHMLVYNATTAKWENKAQSAIAHNSFSGIQGGTTNEYYHLTAAANSALTGSGNTTLHYHSADRDLANSTGTLSVVKGGTGLTSVAINQILYTSAASTFAPTSITAYGRSLIDDADAATARTTLGLSAAAIATVGGIAPVALGTANEGSSAALARVDHVHPTTGLMLTTHAANSITGFAGSGSATTVSRSDHSHSGTYEPANSNIQTHIAAATGAEHGATSTNTANMIVSRDASGNFVAGTITATLSGNASTATNVAWSGVTSKPNTASGYGITDVMLTSHAANSITGFGTTTAALGTTAAGTSTLVSRADHVHPTTGLMLTTHAANSITGFGTTAVALGTAAAGTSTLVSRADHVHPTTGLALLSGATFTGAVTLAGDPTADLHAVTRKWVQGRPAKDSARVATTADLGVVAVATQTLTGPPTTYTTNGTTTASSTSVTGVSNASAYVKVGATVTGTGIQASTTVAAVSGSTITLSQVATAAGTVSLTFTQTISALVIDSITLNLNDRVIVKNQNTASQNGIYELTTLGTTSVPWVLTRSAGGDVWNDLVSAIISVDEGTVNVNTTWFCTAIGGGTLGSTAIGWQLLSNMQVSSLGTLSTNGILARTATNTITARSIAVSGTGLAISNADGVSGNPTITSNATSANTASTIVARDASGNFTAGTITATLSGNASTATNVAWSGVTSKPNTASGYGITDVMLTTHAANAITGFGSTVSNIGTASAGTSTLVSRADHVHSNTGLLSTSGGTISGKVTISKAVGTASNYTTGQLELNAANATDDVTLGFHRPGATACALKHRGDGLLLHGTTEAYATFKAGTIYSNDVQVATVSQIPTMLPANGGIADSATNATNAKYVFNDNTNMAFHWSGKTGQPAWLWGGDVPGNMYVYNPSNFNVNSATTAANLSGFFNSNASNPVSADSVTTNGMGYVTGISLLGQVDGALYVQAYSDKYMGQIFQDYRTGRLAYRGKNNGTFTGWLTSIDSGNIGSQSVNYATTAGSAAKLTTSKTITLSGDVTGSVAFDGSANVTIAATVVSGGNISNIPTSDIGGNIWINENAGAGLEGTAGVFSGTASAPVNPIVNQLWFDTGSQRLKYWNGTSWTKMTGVNDSVGIGSVVFLSNTNVPIGWMECDGRAIGRTAYPELFAAIGTIYGAGNGSTTFNIPDLRGEFLRGWDHGRNVDQFRELGSSQDDMLESHNHIDGYAGVNAGSSFGVTTAPAGNINSQSGSGTANHPYTSSTGDVETRPRNIAMMAVIKVTEFDRDVNNSNAATLQGKGAADFATADHTHVSYGRTFANPTVRQTVLSGNTNLEGQANFLQSSTYSQNVIYPLTANANTNGTASASSIYNTSYDAWKAFDYLEDTAGWMTVNGTKTGWLQYDFVTSKIISKYTIFPIRQGDNSQVYFASPKDWTFEAWNGTAWVVLDTRKEIVNWVLGVPNEFVFNNTTAYTRYRINITDNCGYSGYTGISELTMHERIPYGENLLTPIFGSNENAGYIISASSIYSTTYDAWKAFSGSQIDTYDAWLTASGTVQGWLAVEFSEPRTVGRYVVTARNDITTLLMAPKDWTFEAWNGTSWIVLDTRSSEINWNRFEKRAYTFTNNTAYRKYRINITANVGSTAYTAIGGLEMYEAYNHIPVNSVVVAGDITPVVLTASGGFDTAGPVDYVGRVASRVEISGFMPDTVNYIYAEIASNGTITYGTTNYAPVYSKVDPFYQDVNTIPTQANFWASISAAINSNVGMAKASTTYGASNLAWYSFDNNTTTSWATASTTKAGWLMYVHPYSKNITRYCVGAAHDANYATGSPSAWTFEGFNNTTNTWDVLDTRTGIGWASSSEKKYFTCSNTKFYRRYRLNITNNGGLAYTYVSALEMYDTQNGLHWFDLSNMTMKMWNGSTWTQKNRVFIGEVRTDSIGNVIGVTSYNYNGQYISGWFPVALNTKYVKSHNLGLMADDIWVYWKRFFADEEQHVVTGQYYNNNGGMGAYINSYRNIAVVSTAYNFTYHASTSAEAINSASSGGFWSVGFYCVYTKRGW